MEKCDKRVVIIQAALELVAEQGFHGTPMASVAERAGVAAGTIYRYFESKDVLIRESYAELEKRLSVAVRENYPNGRPVRERFIHMLRVIVAYCIASPMEFRFLEQFHNSPYGVAHRREKIFGRHDNDFCAELFDEGLQQQIIKDLPLPILFALTFGPIVDVCRDHILQFIELDDTLIVRTVEACWDAVKR
jgi:AcrR family transcriptional regulator